MQRSATIDIMKGIAIILVVAGHYAPADAPAWYLEIVKGIYSFHMPLFMFLSGLLFCATMRPGESYAGFMRRKTLRLMVPYLFASVMIIGVKAASDSILQVDHPVHPGTALMQMFYLPSAAYFLWFLWALWLIFFVAAALRTVKSRDIFLLATLAAAALPVRWPEAFCIRQAVDFAPFFAIGMSVWDHRDLLAPLRRAVHRLPWVAVLLFPALYLASIAIDIPVLRGAVEFAVALAGIITVAVLSEMAAGSRLSKTVIAVGAASFAIYLFHTSFEGLAKALTGRIIPADSSQIVFIAEAAAVIAAGVLAPMLLHRHIFCRWKLLSVLTATPMSLTKAKA